MSGLEGLRTRPVSNRNQSQGLEGLRHRPVKKQEEGDSWWQLPKKQSVNLQPK